MIAKHAVISASECAGVGSKESASGLGFRFGARLGHGNGTRIGFGIGTRRRLRCRSEWEFEPEFGTAVGVHEVVCPDMNDVDARWDVDAG
jgi:hypothetical protein